MLSLGEVFSFYLVRHINVDGLHVHIFFRPCEAVSVTCEWSKISASRMFLKALIQKFNKSFSTHFLHSGASL